MEKVIKTTRDFLVHGALARGWGGPVCHSAVSLETHAFESTAWIVIGIAVIFGFNIPKKYKQLRQRISADISAYKTKPRETVTDKLLALVLLAMFFQVVYYKINIRALINMTQPCHVILLLEGIALYSDGPLGVMISLLVLPALIGTLLAMIFPETSGLDQPFEETAYWVQHYIIQIMPLYLLVRRNFLALKHAGLFTISCGLLVLLFLHFSLYEAIDLVLSVNVEFMLCPTDSMVTIFSTLPDWLNWPSYRSTLTYAVIVVAFPLSYSYIYSAKLLRLLSVSLKTAVSKWEKVQ